MAIYRTIHISFWTDPYVINLTPEGKYFYIYLMTNSKTNQLGCYEIAKKIIVDETGYSKETVEKLLDKFVDDKKIMYSEQTNEILLLNWHKYSWSKSPKVEICIKKEFSSVKNEDFKEILSHFFIDHRYSMDSLWIKETKTKEETKTETKEETIEEEIESMNPFDKVIDLYNSTCISLPKVKVKTEARKKTVNTRLKKYSMDDFYELFILAEESDFLCGRIKKKKEDEHPFKASFDWLLNETNMAKVLEGNYKNKGADHGTKSVSGTVELSYAEKQIANGYVPKQHTENPFE